MTSHHSDLSSQQPSARRRPFRVQQYNRALGLVTAVLLLLGFGVLRLLTGADDTPVVESGEVHLQVAPLEPPPRASQDVHRLRPQTTATPSGELTHPLIEEPGTWQNQPATYWQLAPIDEAVPQDIDVARQPDLLR